MQEFGNARWLWCILPVWLAMHRRGWLVAGLITGVALGQVTQILEWIGLKYSVPVLVWPHPPSDVPVARISGWWHHPVMAGVILVGALGLHLPAAVFGWGWRRTAGICGGAASCVGLIATGSRGAWLGALGLILLTMTIALCRLRGRHRHFVLIGAGALLLGGGCAAWGFGGHIITLRVESAAREIRSAIERRDYSSDTGARIRFAMWAVQMIREKPFAGHGVGSYEYWIRSQEGDAGANTRVAPQAHNTLLHGWATMGLPGAALLLGLAGVGIAGGLRAARETAQIDPSLHDWMGTYCAGPPWALVGITLMSAVETIHVNIQPAAFASALLCLCVPFVPQRRRL
jgi:O-antigen ligase